MTQYAFSAGSYNNGWKTICCGTNIIANNLEPDCIYFSSGYKDKKLKIQNTTTGDSCDAFLTPAPARVIFNDPATIVFFEDGTKTVVKCMKDQEYNPEIGFLLCVMKRVYSDNYRKLMWKYCWGGE